MKEEIDFKVDFRGIVINKVRARNVIVCIFAVWKCDNSGKEQYFSILKKVPSSRQLTFSSIGNNQKVKIDLKYKIPEQLCPYTKNKNWKNENHRAVYRSLKKYCIDYNFNSVNSNNISFEFSNKLYFYFLFKVIKYSIYNKLYINVCPI